MLEIGEKPKRSVRGLEHIQEVGLKRCFERKIVAVAAAEGNADEIVE
jgi:hypothetical protein